LQMGIAESEPMLKPVKRVTLTESIMRQLVEYIRGELEPGERLPSERALLEHLGVGRTSVRESIRALEVLGFVETRPGEGTFVTGDTGNLFGKPLEFGLLADKRSIMEVYEARRILEVGMMPLAAARITEEAVAVCRELVARMAAQGWENLNEFLEYDYQFHRVITEATGNGVLQEVLNLAHRLMEEERRKALLTPEIMALSVKQHEKIFSALAQHDAAAATVAMEGHMDLTRRLLGISEKDVS
jgi:GntR family transcriptional regulator, transcriptional repressor for pyruvate dehydrogenase complex